MKKNTAGQFQDVLDLIRTLRGEGGCPWDRKQTIETLTKYVHSEFQELAEALEDQAPEKIQEEMGDLLFLLLFIAEVAREKGQFAIDDVFDQVKTKMIGRHPHVFGDVSIDGVEDVKDNWKKIKAQEKLRASQQTLVEKMPRNLPALQQALWALDNVTDGTWSDNDLPATVDTVEHDVDELRAAIQGDEKEATGALVGKVLFSLVKVSRLLDVTPQKTLRETVRRFLEDCRE